MTMPNGIIELRSDTFTQPTDSMRQAMAEAVVGDDMYGEDPTVRRLEELAAELVGKPAALYVPSGTMGNQIALRLWAKPGTEVLCSDRCHIRQYEFAGAAQNAGVGLRSLPDRDGTFSGAQVDSAVADGNRFLAKISLVCIENTNMPSGGRPWTLSQISKVAERSRVAGVPLHCDGARIFNAQVALGVSAQELCSEVDSVMFCLSKGLAAPVGSMLAGPRDFIDAAREERTRLGGSMRQSGVIAAAGIVALETMIDRLGDDHSNAKRLAQACAELFPGCIDPDTVQTNMVCLDAAHLPPDLEERLKAQGIRAGLIDNETFRFATHKDVSEADIDTTITVLAKVVSS